MCFRVVQTVDFDFESQIMRGLPIFVKTELPNAQAIMIAPTADCRKNRKAAINSTTEDAIGLLEGNRRN